MVYRFGGYEVDLATFEVRRNGRVVPVQPQVFAVIRLLIEQRDRVVTKEEILDQVWGDRFVSESALTSRIKSARQALGDSGAAQEVILTVIGRGYRFVATLDDAEPPPAADADLQGHELTDHAALGQELAARGDAPDGVWPTIGRREDADLIQRLAADGTTTGVRISGPENVGAFEFADSCRAAAEAHGMPTAHVIGSRAAASIPLACLAHLLPVDVTSTEQPASDLARAEVHRRATEALSDLAGSDRLFLVIENADRLDDMSSAVLTSSMMQRRVFGVFVGATPAAEVDEPSTLAEVKLRPLSEVEVDTTLHRVLAGPIAAETLAQLFASSGGLPELLRDIVETSQAAGTLRREHGVWRLTGPPTTTASHRWHPELLSSEAVEAAETLALFEGVPESLAAEWCGADALEELDNEQMITVDLTVTPAAIALGDPLLSASVRASTRPLRERRIKDRVLQSVELASAPPAVLAVILSWPESNGSAIEPAVVLGAAYRAMRRGDLETAARLADSLDEPVPDLVALQAEVAHRRLQRERAEQLFTSVDLDELSTGLAELVVRRRSSLLEARSRVDEAMAVLDTALSEPDQLEERTRNSFIARKASMLSSHSRPYESFVEIDRLGDAEGFPRLEAEIGRAGSLMQLGRFEEALIVLDVAESILKGLPTFFGHEARDAALMLRCGALGAVGSLQQACDLARHRLPHGKRVDPGFASIAASWNERLAGRNLAARSLLHRAMSSSHLHSYPQYSAIVETEYALCALLAGDPRPAERDIDRLMAAESTLAGRLRWMVLMPTSMILAKLRSDYRIEELLQAAAVAADLGCLVHEADLLYCAAIDVDPTTETAQAVGDRFTEIVGEFDGQFWPIRADHVLAKAEQQPLDDVDRRYAELGYFGMCSTPKVTTDTP